MSDTPSKRPTLVSERAPLALPPSPEEAVERQQATLAQQVSGLVLDELRAHQASQAPAVPPPPGPGRSRDPVLVALTIAGALLYQRGETTQDQVDQQAAASATVQATLAERLDAYERQALADREQAIRGENTMRETLFIMSEDSRAEWDALAQIHAATRASGAPDLRMPATADRLTALREAMAVDRRDVP